MLPSRLSRAGTTCSLVGASTAGRGRHRVGLCPGRSTWPGFPSLVWDNAVLCHCLLGLECLEMQSQKLSLSRSATCGALPYLATWQPSLWPLLPRPSRLELHHQAAAAEGGDHLLGHADPGALVGAARPGGLLRGGASRVWPRG